MKRIAWKSILITFAISFILGTAFGRWELSQGMHDKWKDPAERQKWILKRLDAGLNLDADQEAKIAAILKESAPQMETVRSKIRPELDALREQVRQKITPILTPDQQVKYDQMEKEWQERKRKYRESFTPATTQPS